MTVQWRIAPEKLMDTVEQDRVKQAMALLKIGDGSAIDSYEMSANGPILTAIYVVNKNYLVEIKLNGKKFQFDVTGADALINYRVAFGEHVAQAEGPAVPAETSPVIAREKEIPVPGPAQTVKFVMITLRHTDGLATEMSCFGDETDAWLEYALDAYPKSHLIGA